MTFPDYQNKCVVVTGSSSGIGEAVATSLVDLGANVHTLGLSEPSIEGTSFSFVDLSDPETIASAVRGIDEEVDALFNCAGAPPMAPASEILAVNFLGLRYLTDLMLERMSSGAAIASTSSDGGIAWRRKRELIQEFVATSTFKGGLDWFEKNKRAAGHPYAFGKEALNVWTMQMSAVLITRGIRINTSSPGAVQTPMLEAIEEAYGPEAIAASEQPCGRRSTPREQAGPLLFLNSDSASYVNGADLAVDGGFWAQQSVAGALGG